LVYQPWAPSVPVLTARPALGGVWSTFTVSGAAFPTSPALSVHEPLKTVPAVSSSWSWPGVQVTGPLTESDPVVETVGLDTNQPFRPGTPDAARLAAGADSSSSTVTTLLGSLVLPAASDTVEAV